MRFVTATREQAIVVAVVEFELLPIDRVEPHPRTFCTVVGVPGPEDQILVHVVPAPL